jgi:transcriptional regulator with XRE-family HTH domain
VACSDTEPTVRVSRSNSVDAHVGRRIRLRRTLLGLSQERLADALGLTFQQVQKYEKGVNRVGASRLFDLARVLDVPIGYFFDDIPDNQVKRPAEPAAAAAVANVAYEQSVKRETLDLVRAYYAIRDPQIRRRVYDLAKALGDAAG